MFIRCPQLTIGPVLLSLSIITSAWRRIALTQIREKQSRGHFQINIYTSKQYISCYNTYVDTNTFHRSLGDTNTSHKTLPLGSNTLSLAVRQHPLTPYKTHTPHIRIHQNPLVEPGLPKNSKSAKGNAAGKSLWPLSQYTNNLTEEVGLPKR